MKNILNLKLKALLETFSGDNNQKLEVFYLNSYLRY